MCSIRENLRVSQPQARTYRRLKFIRNMHFREANSELSLKLLRENGATLKYRQSRGELHLFIVVFNGENLRRASLCRGLSRVYESTLKNTNIVHTKYE